ncbi:MAG: hypothetical protein ACR2JW_15245 [Thermomicrobiales bacterium]
MRMMRAGSHPAQRIALEALAVAQQVSISTVVRQFIATGLAADAVLV